MSSADPWVAGLRLSASTHSGPQMRLRKFAGSTCSKIRRSGSAMLAYAKQTSQRIPQRFVCYGLNGDPAGDNLLTRIDGTSLQAGQGRPRRRHIAKDGVILKPIGYN